MTDNFYFLHKAQQLWGSLCTMLSFSIMNMISWKEKYNKMVLKKTPTHQYSHHVNIKEKITFWDMLGTLMSGNKNMLLTQFCKELPKASKPSDPLMPGHPTQIISKSQPTSHSYNNSFHFAENGTKQGERAGPAMYKMTLKSHFTYSHQSFPIYSAFQSGNCSVVMFSDCTFQSSRSVFP